MIKRFILILALVLASGCAEMNTNFDCPMKGGTNCASLDQNNAKVDRGEIGGIENTAIDHKPIIVDFQHIQTVPFTKCSHQKPQRIGETVQHIWIAPFEDTAGNYHQDGDIYTVIRPGAWTGLPINTIHDEEE